MHRITGGGEQEGGRDGEYGGGIKYENIKVDKHNDHHDKQRNRCYGDKPKLTLAADQGRPIGLEAYYRKKNHDQNRQNGKYLGQPIKRTGNADNGIFKRPESFD